MIHYYVYKKKLTVWIFLQTELGLSDYKLQPTSIKIIHTQFEKINKLVERSETIPGVGFGYLNEVSSILKLKLFNTVYFDLV